MFKELLQNTSTVRREYTEWEFPKAKYGYDYELVFCSKSRKAAVYRAPKEFLPDTDNTYCGDIFFLVFFLCMIYDISRLFLGQ